MSLTTRALHPLFGAELVGSTSSARTTRHSPRSWPRFDEHSVLLFRGQSLTDEEQIAFSRRFGPLETTIRSIASREGTPVQIANLSNVDGENRLIPTGDKRNLYNAGNQMWHTDSSFKKVPAHASLLSAREIPPEGGETQFASMRVAYGRLPADMQRFLEDKVAVHSFVYSRGLVGRRADAARSRGPGAAGAPGAGAGQPGQRPPRVLRGLARVRDRRHADRGGARAPARAARGGHPARAGLHPPLAGGRSRDVGQPLHAPPRAAVGRVPLSPGHAPDHGGGRGAHRARRVRRPRSAPRARKTWPGAAPSSSWSSLPRCPPRRSGRARRRRARWS